MHGSCARCLRFGLLEEHHPTDRRDGKPLDPDLVEWLCPTCHDAETTAQRVLGIELPCDPYDTPGDIARRLRCVSVTLGLTVAGLFAALGAGVHPLVAIGGLVALAVALVRVLQRWADLLDTHIQGAGA